MNQKDAKEVISTLSGAFVPDIGLELFTCGDNFRHQLLRVKTEILSLQDEQKALEYILLGGFGMGKSHFLKYLRWELKRELVNSEFYENALICNMDMTKLLDAGDFELELIKSLRTFNGEGYAVIFKKAYQRVKDLISSQYSGKNRVDIQKTYENFLYSALGFVVPGLNISDFLKETNPLKKAVEFVINKVVINANVSDALKKADATHRQFVEAFFQMVGNDNNMNASAILKPAQELSKEHLLADVVFKILKLSGFKLVIILIDEMETLKDEQDKINAKGKGILEKMRDFRDRLNEITSDNRSYPSVAMVVASTNEFFEKTLAKSVPALHNRWDFDKKRVNLEPMSNADIDNIIFKMRELYFLAGIRLKKIEENESGEHDVIALRKKIIDKLNTKQNAGTRNLIQILIDELDSCKL